MTATPSSLPNPWARLTSRGDVPAFLQARGYRRLAEVGVRAGAFLGRLRSANPELLIGVDIWADDGKRVRNDAGYTSDQYLNLYRSICARYEGDPTVRLIRGETLAAAALLAGEGVTLDFVYLDACHTQEEVAADIAAWWPLIVPGGTLSGHDYYPRPAPHPISGARYGVFEAVNNFVKETALPLRTTTRDQYPSWFVEKPL